MASPMPTSLPTPSEDPTAIPSDASPIEVGKEASPSDPVESAKGKEAEGEEDKEHDEIDVVLEAHITSLRLLLSAWLTHFNSLGYIRDSTMDMLDKNVLRNILKLSVHDPRARLAMGSSTLLWQDTIDLLRLATPSLESRSYAVIPDPYEPNSAANAVVYDGPSSNVIVQHHQTLLRDIQRMNNILCVSRNILTAGAVAQNVAAQLSIDREVCCLINLCVKITARGYDGDGTSVDESKWQAVINEYKKLLITCLQLLSNMAILNERLKLMLWVELFDSSSEGNVTSFQDPTASIRPSLQMTAQEAESDWLLHGAQQLALGSQQFMRQSKRPADEGEGVQTPSAFPRANPVRSKSSTSIRKLRAIAQKYPPPKQAHELWLDDNMANLTAHLKANDEAEPNMKDMERYAKRLFDSWPEAKTAPYREKYLQLHREWCSVPELEDVANMLAKHVEAEALNASNTSKAVTESSLNVRSRDYSVQHDGAGLKAHDPVGAPLPPCPLDPSYRFIESAQDGLQKLEEGKRELLKRLDTQPRSASLDDVEAARSTSPGIIQSPASPMNTAQAGIAPEILLDDQPNANGDDKKSESEVYSSDHEYQSGEEADDRDGVDGSSADDDYDPVPGEDGRGLLTDVPLILGPNEIEVLPMIIMSGIVTEAGERRKKQDQSAEQLQLFLNMYTIRCHLLLAQENGRNLLRELLIFVAAWDLREEELYFKFMVKIMESILMHGLMPFAYSAFKESKDIISPAQAVLMKLLTKIFHSRQAFIHAPDAEEFALLPQSELSSDPSRTVVSTIFSEFRSNIIPQICALIFLQGQIREGRASIEEFPLNLWDMERMYEGVYQYLEFFAILTDHEEWKTFMADWEVASELVTLLRELEAGIGKRILVRPTMPVGHSRQQVNPTSNPDETSPLGSPEPKGPQAAQRSDTLSATAAIERPYSPLPAVPAQSPSSRPTTTIPNPSSPPQEPAHDAGDSGLANHASPIHEEPAEFEWRNLKKLCVLVLSSLVWKNKTLQDQVLRFGGIETILRCCQHDEHNPYIREHAIMCLRFCVEGNDEVRNVIKEIINRGTQQSQDPTADGASEDATTTLHRTNGQDAVLSQVSEIDDTLDPATHDTQSLIVPPEVLDSHGYETFMDGKGQVGLRRKDAFHPPSAGSPPRDYDDSRWNDGSSGDEELDNLVRDDGSILSANQGNEEADALHVKERPSGWEAAALKDLSAMSRSDRRGSDGQARATATAGLAKPRSAADLPGWVEAITRDLPHKKLERDERVLS